VKSFKKLLRMSRKDTAWSTTSYRDSSSGGYVPSSNDTAFSGTSFRSSDPFAPTPAQTYNDPFNHSYVDGGYVPGGNTSFRSGPTPAETYNDPFNHSYVDGGYVPGGNTSFRSSDSFDHRPHHSSGSTIGNIARNVYDSINSRIGGEHISTTYPSTSTRSSDPFGGTGTSFR
jgi:hypothetical protein